MVYKLAKALCLLFCLMILTPQAKAVSTGQFAAKLYTEALGRAPDPGGWAGVINNFGTYGCQGSTMASLVYGFYQSQEYTNLGYDNVEKLLTLYHGVLAREPDVNGFSYYLNRLNSGEAFTGIINEFLNSTEFSQIASYVCSDSASVSTGYGFGNVGAIAVPIGSSGFNGSDTDLQAVLNSSAPGTTVYLAQRALIAVSSGRQIVVPAGVTLTTYGSLSRNQYAKMARIVRNSNIPSNSASLSSALVVLSSGSHLDTVWVSGQRQAVNYTGNAVNIFIPGGSGTTVSNSRTDNPAAFTSILAYGTGETGSACSATITNNLITGYTNTHTGGQFSDGISTSCDMTTVTSNEIIDPSDVGVVVYRSSPGNQGSYIARNTIISAGVPSYGAYVFDPLDTSSGTSAASFTNATIDSNHFWAAAQTHFDIGLSVGTFPYPGINGHRLGVNAVMTNNDNAGIATPMRVAIAVDGMLNTTVNGNNLLRTSPGGNFRYGCTEGNVLADIVGGHASGTIQANSQATLHDCNGH